MGWGGGGWDFSWIVPARTSLAGPGHRSPSYETESPLNLGTGWVSFTPCNFVPNRLIRSARDHFNEANRKKHHSTCIGHDRVLSPGPRGAQCGSTELGHQAFEIEYNCRPSNDIHSLPSRVQIQRMGSGSLLSPWALLGENCYGNCLKTVGPSPPPTPSCVVCNCCGAPLWNFWIHPNLWCGLYGLSFLFWKGL